MAPKITFKNLVTRFLCLDHKFLIANLISRNLKVKYRQSFGGMLWTMLIPLSTASVFYFVFKFYMKIQVEHYLSLIMTGIISWNYFSSSVAIGTESIVNNCSILSKVPVKPNVFPFTDNLTQFINSFISLPVILAILIFDGVSFSPLWLLYPLLLVPLFFISYSITYLLSLCYVFFRDLRHLLTVGLQMLFYLSPVIYPFEMVPEQFKPLFLINPLGGFFITSQDILVHGELLHLPFLYAHLAWTAFFMILAGVISLKFQGEIVENI